MKRVIASLAGVALAFGILCAAWAGPAPGSAGTPPGSASKPPSSSSGTTQKTPSKKQQKLGTKVINLNTASEKELRQLTGIGKERAAKIVKARPLAKVDDLVSKKIMSAKELDKIRSNVTVK
jgi:DNA uptake protein ComE-like DNA-binding protein